MEIKKEPPLFRLKGSPRFLVPYSKIKKIKNKLIIDSGNCCQKCKKSFKIYDIHESYTVKSGLYKFEGFIILCRECHRWVHATMDYLSIRQLSRFERNKNEIFEVNFNTLEFLLCKEKKVDYSAAEIYGLDPQYLEEKFYEKNDLEGIWLRVLCYVFDDCLNVFDRVHLKSKTAQMVFKYHSDWSKYLQFCTKGYYFDNLLEMEKEGLVTLVQHEIDTKEFIKWKKEFPDKSPLEFFENILSLRKKKKLERKPNPHLLS